MIYNHIDGVEVRVQFPRDNNPRYRYRLEIVLNNAEPAGKTVCAVMQNPSYAGEDVADKSVQFLERLVFKKGLPEFEGARRLILVNQFAYIKTDEFEGRPDQIGELNDTAIKDALNESDIVVLAWGSSNRFVERQQFVLNLLGRMANKTIFKTKMHPSRGRYVGFIQNFSLQKRDHPARQDPFFDAVWQLVIETRNPSVSLAQRRFKLGYNRANSILEAMEGDLVTSKDESGWRNMLNGETAARES